jgi:hypothetical protein
MITRRLFCTGLVAAPLIIKGALDWTPKRALRELVRPYGFYLPDAEPGALITLANDAGVILPVRDANGHWVDISGPGLMPFERKICQLGPYEVATFLRTRDKRWVPTFGSLDKIDAALCMPKDCYRSEHKLIGRGLKEVVIKDGDSEPWIIVVPDTDLELRDT